MDNDKYDLYDFLSDLNGQICELCEISCTVVLPLHKSHKSLIEIRASWIDQKGHVNQIKRRLTDLCLKDSKALKAAQHWMAKEFREAINTSAINSAA